MTVQATIALSFYFIFLLQESLQQTTNDIYVVLNPGFHFRTKAIIYTSPATAPYPSVYGYGGWFKDPAATLRLPGYSNAASTSMNNNSMVLVKHLPSASLSTSLPKNTWVFVFWLSNLSPLTSSQTKLDENSLPQSFVPVTASSAYTNFLPASASGAEKSVAPLSMGDPDINGTSWFEVFASSELQQSGLFYALADTQAVLENRLIQYMVGPYNGDIKYHNAHKYNQAMSDQTIYYSNLTYRSSGWTVMKALVDDYGTFIPKNQYWEIDSYFDANYNPSTMHHGNVRTFIVQAKFSRNASGDAPTDLLTANANVSWVTSLYPPGDARTQPCLRVIFSFKRSTAKAIAIIQAGTDNATIYYTYSEFLTLSGLNGLETGVIHMRISIIVTQNEVETDASRPIVNMAIEVNSRIGDVITRDNVYAGPVKLSFDPMQTLSVITQNSYATGVPALHHMYSEFVAETRGGFSYTYTGLPPASTTINVYRCTSISGIVVDGKIVPYCQMCSSIGVIDPLGGSCTNYTTGGLNATCSRYKTAYVCVSCDAGFIYSEVEDLCYDTCPAATHTNAARADPDYQRTSVCIDEKFITAGTNCYYYSRALTTQPTCVCQVASCNVCMHTPCDRCATGAYLKIHGILRTCVTAMPSGFGPDPFESIPTVKPCMAAGCAACDVDYRLCTSCSGTLKLDTVRNTCVACLATAGRYYNAVAQTCSPCDFSCTTCNGTSTTSCLTCPLTVPASFLRISDNMCTACVSGTEYFTSGSLTYGVTQLATPPLRPTCLLCDATCKDCSGPGALQCTTCRVDLFKYPSGSCGLCTETGVYKNAPDCKACHANCLGCTGPTSSDCTSCNVPIAYMYSNSTCAPCIPASTPFYIDGNICRQCHSSCKTCFGPLDTNCNSCTLPNFLLANGTCVACDEEGFFQETSTGKCQPCNLACKACSGTATFCTLCPAGKYLYPDNHCGVCTEDFVYPANSPIPSCLSCHNTCLRCSGPSQSECTSCTSPLYLYPDSTCKTCTPASQPFFINGGACVPCESSCKTCFGALQTQCSSCTLPKYLNPNSTCGACADPGYFQETSTGKCNACDPSCKTCLGSATYCTLCPAGKYLYPDNHCGNCNESRRYPNTLSLTCDSCHTSCLTCTGPSATECTSCASPLLFYSSNSTCASCQSPGLFYPNLTSNKCEPCHPSCITCSGGGSDRCLTCNSLKYLTDEQQCVACYDIGMFVLNNAYCKQCDANCLACSMTATHCTACDTANGYILVNGTCKPDSTPLYLNCTATIPSSAQVGLSFVLLPNDTWSYKQLHEVYAGMKLSLAFKPDASATYTLSLATPGFQVDIAPPTLLSTIESVRRVAKVEIIWVPVPTSENGTDYKLRAGACTGLYDFGPTVDEIKAAESQAAVVSGLTSTMSSTDSAVGMSLMGTLLAADPTGTFFRFTKILQIVNKLYFININYGKRLEAFLAKTALPDGKKKETIPINNIKNYRGKLSQNKITLDFVAAMSDKVVLYLISWILKGVKRLLLDNCIMGKIGIYFCHYANRAHLIIFNLVFIDFIWLAPRTLMHAQDLSIVKDVLPLVVMCLIAADLCLILSHLLDDRIWRKALEHYTSLREFCPIPQTKAKQAGGADNSADGMPLREPGSAPKQDDPNQDQTKQINYKKTYFEIDFNVHLMDMATNTLRVDESVYQSKLCRLLAAGIWLRVNVIQLAILSCQYANTLGLTVLLIIELSRLFATIYAYLKYKYLKNTICYWMEICNSASLTLFFLNALLISPKRFDELIMDFYQDAGIWIVIASCVAEYLLLLTYIGVATYDFFKNRKMMKRMNVQHRQYNFMQIQYVKRLNDVSTVLHTEQQDQQQQQLSSVRQLKSRAQKKRALKRGVHGWNFIEPIFKSLKIKPTL